MIKEKQCYKHSLSNSRLQILKVIYYTVKKMPRKENLPLQQKSMICLKSALNLKWLQVGTEHCFQQRLFKAPHVVKT